MPDTVSSGLPDRRIHWARAISAGVIATVVMTIVMMLLKMNLMKSMGTMIVGANASPALQYAVGGTIHFMIGIIYGIIFAALVGRVIEWNGLVKGVVYGLAIGAIALAAMPVMSAMRGSGGAQKQPAMNPCHSQSTGMASSSSAMNPCHPKSPTSAMNACHGGGAGNPCNPCGGGGPWSGAISVLNHLVYALTLAFAYGKVR